MKAYNRICIIFSFLIIVIFTISNILLINLNSKNDDNREYRVEINRISIIIENEGIDNIDFNKYDYVYNVVECNDTFYNTDNDYVIKKINDKLYRFDYNTSIKVNILTIVLLNIILSLLSILIIFLLIFFKRKIIKPFNTLSDVPYQLSKGNLTAPLEEDKSRYFGKFVWGVDLLRESLENQKERELQLEKEKKTLLLSLSHDIKTPLSAIKLYSNALSKGLYNDTAKQKEIAISIDENVNEIESYVSEIIKASKEDFLSLEVNNSEFYLNDLFTEINNYYKEKLALVKIDFSLNNDINCLIKGDYNRSIEVLQNIVENAIKYGDGRIIEINSYEEDGAILTEIKNSGNTLSINELPHIFESFYRGTNIHNAKGSGLGLYICKELMHKMHGDIFAKIDNEYIMITCVFNKA